MPSEEKIYKMTQFNLRKGSVEECKLIFAPDLKPGNVTFKTTGATKNCECGEEWFSYKENVGITLLKYDEQGTKTFLDKL